MMHSKPPRTLLLGVVAIAGVAVASYFDSWFWSEWIDTEKQSSDWRRLFRASGFLPFWLVMALALALIDWPRRQRSGRWEALGRARDLAFPVTAAAVLAEALKWCIGRERPGDDSAAYVFRSWSERTLSTEDLGFPSSHATVAFAAATALTRLFPRAAPIWYGFAVGGGLGRVTNHAHYFSDVIAGVFVGTGVAWLLTRGTRRKKPADAAEKPRAPVPATPVPPLLANPLAAHPATRNHSTDSRLARSALAAPRGSNTS